MEVNVYDLLKIVLASIDGSIHKNLKWGTKSDEYEKALAEASVALKNLMKLM